jgi:hypothetical protein
MDKTRKINEYWMQERGLNGYKKVERIDARMMWKDVRMINYKYMQER